MADGGETLADELVRLVLKESLGARRDVEEGALEGEYVDKVVALLARVSGAKMRQEKGRTLSKSVRLSCFRLESLVSWPLPSSQSLLRTSRCSASIGTSSVIGSAGWIAFVVSTKGSTGFHMSSELTVGF